MKKDALRLPVKIIEVTDQSLRVQVVSKRKDCPQCASGKGCGETSWFRPGNSSPLDVPIHEGLQKLKAGDGAELLIPVSVFTRLCLLAYGLPLLALLVTLLMLGNLPSIWQFVLGLLSLLLTMLFTRHFALRLLQKELRLNPLPNHAKGMIEGGLTS